MKYFKRLSEYCMMGFHIVSRTKWGAQRKMDEKGPRRFHVLGCLFAHDNANGGNTRFFQRSGDQSHGLLAYGSAGNQQGRFCSGCQQSLSRRRGGGFD